MKKTSILLALTMVAGAFVAAAPTASALIAENQLVRMHVLESGDECELFYAKAADRFVYGGVVLCSNIGVGDCTTASVGRDDVATWCEPHPDCSFSYVEVAVVEFCSNLLTSGCTIASLGATDLVAWCGPTSGCSFTYVEVTLVEVCSNLGQSGCTSIAVGAERFNVCD